MTAERVQPPLGLLLFIRNSAFGIRHFPLARYGAHQVNPPSIPSETGSPNGAPAAANPPSDRADLRPESINDAVIRLAGDSQDGIQSAGAFLARLAGRSAQDVMTYMTIPATISGGPSIFQVRIGTGEVLSAGDEADFLVAFYQHSYQDHIGFLKDRDFEQPCKRNGNCEGVVR